MIGIGASIYLPFHRAIIIVPIWLLLARRRETLSAFLAGNGTDVNVRDTLTIPEKWLRSYAPFV
jgi:hypothetical protein